MRQFVALTGMTPFSIILLTLKGLKMIFKKKVIILIISSFLLILTSRGAEDVKQLKVVSDQANIRLKPDIGSIIIEQVPEGTLLEYIEKEGEWYLVKVVTERGVASGYVHQSLVIELSPQLREEIIKKIEPEKIIKEETRLPRPKAKETLPSERPPLTFKISGGGILFRGGDLNRGAQGLADFYRDAFGMEGEGEVKTLKLSPIFGAEMSFSLLKMLSLGTGFDYFLRERESQVLFEEGNIKNRFITNPGLRALPLRIVLILTPSNYFYLKGGIEYFFARCSYFYRIEERDSWKEWRGKASASDFGYFGGIGFDGNLLSYLGFFIEAQARYARLSGFKGKGSYSDSEGLQASENGPLYSFEGKISGEKSFPLLFIREKKPTEAGVSNPREALIDLSGMNLRAGITIRF